MKKEQALAKLEELAERYKQSLIERGSSLLGSGAIDLDQFEDNYVLPTILILVAADDVKDRFSIRPEHRKNVEALRRI